MKYYAQFTCIRNKRYCHETNKMVAYGPYHQDKLGSDGVYILDGRTRLFIMIQDAKDRIMKLGYISRIDGFRIMKGESFSKSKEVYFEAYSNFRE